MRSIIWKGLIGVAFTGGLLALGAGAANADDSTTGDSGTGSGSQAVIGLNLPITIGGNGISVLGDSSSSGASTTPPASASAPSAGTGGSNSLLGGTQALVGANAPVTVSGNAISVIGASGSSSSRVGSGSAAGATGSGSGTTSGNDSTLGGTQVLGDVGAPVTVGGNAISVIGDSSSSGSQAGSQPGSFAGQSADGTGSTGTGSTGTGAVTSGDDGILSGTQVIPDVAAPVQASGNAVSVLGDSSSSGATTDSGTGGGSVGGVDTTLPGIVTSGDDGTASGSQIAPSVTAPVTIGGNAVSVVGDSSTTPTDPGQPGEVGGVEVFAPTDPGTVTTAALSEQALAETGVTALPALALGLLLLLAGVGLLARRAAVRVAGLRH